MLSSEDVLPVALARAARETPDAPLFRKVDERGWSFGEMQALAQAWRETLEAAGVTAGDRVATLVPNSADALALWMALGRLRAIEAPINLDYRGDILRETLNYCEARHVIVHERFRSTIDEIAASLAPAPAIHSLREGAEAPAERLVGCGGQAASPVTTAREEEAPRLSDVSLMLFTSGTTGSPKGVLIAWAQIAAAVDRAMGATPMTTYSVAPLFHTGGRGAIAEAILTRRPLVVRERFSASRFWSDVERYGCERANLMAALLDYLGQAGAPPELERSPLRRIGTGRVPESFLPIARALGLTFAAVFNMTEISPPISTGGWRAELEGSCGRIRPGYHCRIVDEEDREVAHGETGELVLRADEPWTLMQGYWRRPEETLRAWRNLWFHTGDVFRRDEDGNFYFIGRRDDRIRRRGENISPEEIEAVAQRHPAVAACSAVGVRTDGFDDEIKLVAELRPGASLSPESLQEFLVERLPRFMTPRYLAFAAALPRTPTGKIRRAVLRQEGVDPRTWDALGPRRDERPAAV